jgi:hypothetical protein
MAIKKDRVITEEITQKAAKTFREREDWWYMNDRDEDSRVEGIRDALNTIMPELRKALFAEFEATRQVPNN